MAAQLFVCIAIAAAILSFIYRRLSDTNMRIPPYVETNNRAAYLASMED